VRPRFPSRGVGLIVAAGLIGLTIGAAIRSFAYYPLRVTSGSMLPTVAVGDWVVIAARHTGSEIAVDRGDIVLFRYPFGGEGRAIKRVIAVAGDEVRIAGPDLVLVNGQANGDTSGHGSSDHGSNEMRDREQDATMRIPDGYFFILGDNVHSSIDSRSLGLLPQTEVVGKVAAVLKKPW
jgi:signal peptidase I